MDKKKAVNINPGQKQPQQQQQASKGTYKNQDIESMLKGLWLVLPLICTILYTIYSLFLY